MKKLALFIYSMGAGGAERVVSNLLPYLAKSFEVHLILMNESIFYELPKQIKVHYLERSNPYENGILKLLKLPLLAFKYKNLCARLGIDLHFVWMNRPCYIAGFARIFGGNKPLIINECSTPSVLYKNAGIKGAINKFLIKKLYAKADFIYPNSKGALDDLAQNYALDASKMKVLYNALNTADIRQKMSEQIELNERFILSVGRLDAGKNHALLINAYKKLKSQIKDAPKLVIIGEGELRAALQNQINELNLNNDVLLLGFRKNPYAYMAKCEFFIFVSRFEGFSNALIEALVCSKCVISSEHQSGAKELFGQNEYGILVPVDDEIATLNAMIKVLNDENIRKHYESKANARAASFDAANIAPKLLSELESFAKS